MSGNNSIDHARNVSELLRRARDQMPMLKGITVFSDDGMVTVNLDLLGRPNIVIDRSRTYSYEEGEVKMIIIDTYNKAIRTQMQ